MREGYIKLWRAIWDNPRIRRNPKFLAVWLWILTHAEHAMVKENGAWRQAKPEEYRCVKFDGQTVRLAPGQVTCGSEQIEAETGVRAVTVRRYLKLMRDEQQIEQRSSNRFSLITVRNWEEYQLNEQQIEQPVSSQRAADEQPVSTIKETKNTKNEISTLSTESVGAALPEAPSPSPAPKKGPNPHVSRLVDTLKSAMGLATLDGTVEKNRFAASNAIQKIAKTAGSEERAADLLAYAIQSAALDRWHSVRMTSLRYVEQNANQLVLQFPLPA